MTTGGGSSPCQRASFQPSAAEGVFAMQWVSSPIQVKLKLYLRVVSKVCFLLVKSSDLGYNCFPFSLSRKGETTLSIWGSNAKAALACCPQACWLPVPIQLSLTVLMWQQRELNWAGMTQNIPIFNVFSHLQMGKPLSSYCTHKEFKAQRTKSLSQVPNLSTKLMSDLSLQTLTLK